jgi:glutathione synthase
LDSTQQALVDAVSNPSKYVVKPQKEGGGNNFYDDEAAQLLKDFHNAPEDKKGPYRQYIIMKRIEPPKIPVWMLKDANVLKMESLSELGLYSVLFLDG